MSMVAHRDPGRPERPGSFISVVVGVAIFLLFLDTLMLARWMGMFSFPGEVDEVEAAKRGATAILSYYERLARSEEETAGGAGGVPQNANIALRAFKLAIDGAATRVGVAQALATYGRRLTTASVPGSGPVAGGEEREGDSSPQAVARQVDDLQQEISLLRAKLRETQSRAGLAEMVGPGVVVRAYDASEGYSWNQIIHERDIRDIVNRLCVAGARGVEVGGERLTVTSSIRCAGPVILVNHRSIAVNPVVIKAVGNPWKLAEALHPVGRDFTRLGKRLLIKIEDAVVLPAYRRGF
ncbi:MAG: DUF881 domain-containing protein [Firmicutes bacterium]|nr:DUF881 domain-containing protein [Bacillota bacterium]